MKKNSANSYLRAISSFFTWLSSRYSVRNIGALVAKIPTLPPKRRILSEDEYQLICQTYDDDRRDIIQFLCHTGLRAFEFVGLTPENIYGGFIHVVGKRAKPRQIPINKTIREILDRDPKLSFIRSPYYDWLWRLCKEITAELKIPEFAPHACRHYFATRLYYQGVKTGKLTMSDLAKILGHANSAITEQIYIHWQTEELNGLTDCLD